MFISTAYAQLADSAQTQGFDIMSFMPFILLVLVFYFLLIRPQQKKMKEHQKMVANLQRGDQVVTAGGLVGKIHKVSESDHAEIEIASGVVVKVLRSTIQNVLGKPEAQVNASSAEPVKKAKKAVKRK